jgi:hypothetical protein
MRKRLRKVYREALPPIRPGCVVGPSSGMDFDTFYTTFPQPRLISFGSTEAFQYNNGPTNQKAAITLRGAKLRMAELEDEYIQHFYDQLYKLYGHHTWKPNVCVIGDDSPIHNYSGLKKVRYMKAAEEMCYPLSKKDFYMSMFVKCENYFEDLKHPRAIYHMKFRALLQHMLIFRYFEKAFLRGPIYPTVGEWCAKGRSPKQQYQDLEDKITACPGYVAITFDASRFEMHFSIYLWFILKAYVMKRTDGGPFWDFLDMLMGWSKDGVFFLGFWLASGRGDTAFVGAAVMTVIITYVMDQFFEHYEYYNAGDDNYVLMPREGISKLPEIIAMCAKFGYHVKVENIAYDPYNLVFCQTKPMYTLQSFIRDYRKVITTMLTTAKTYAPAQFRDYLYSVAFCELCSARGCPIIQPWCQHIMKISLGRFDRNLLPPSYYHRYLQVAHEKPRAITMACRMEFSERFDCLVDEQYRIEESFKSYKIDFSYAPMYYL